MTTMTKIVPRVLVLILVIAGVNAFATTTAFPKCHVMTCTRLFSIVDEVMEEMKAAMKAKETAKVNTIRLMRSSFSNAAIDLKTDKLTDEQAQTVLKKMAKMRKESIDMFEKGGAMDRADAERAELEIIERWLPQMASEDQVREWVKEAIAEVGSDNMGKIMGALMKAHKAVLDGGMAQKVIKEELASSSS